LRHERSRVIRWTRIHQLWRRDESPILSTVIGEKRCTWDIGFRESSSRGQQEGGNDDLHLGRGRSSAIDHRKPTEGWEYYDFRHDGKP
jgi:hypothetical protein